jgi:hypothetical protein
VFCKECGTRVNNNAKYCKYCGAKQSVTEKTEETPFTLKVNKIVLEDGENYYSSKKGVNRSSYPEMSYFGFVYLVFVIYIYISPELRNYLDEHFATSLFTFICIFIGAIFWSVYTAKKLNRSKFGWGFFTFLTPPIALIILGFLKPIKVRQKFKWNDYDTIVIAIALLIIIIILTYGISGLIN